MRAVFCACVLLSTACAAPTQRAAAPANYPANDKEELLKQGYTPSRLNGQSLYCRAEAVTGTQFLNRVCLTEQQIKDQAVATRNTLDSRGMRPNLACHNQSCTR